MDRYDMDRYDMAIARRAPKALVRKVLTEAFEHRTQRRLPPELFLEIWNKIEWSHEPDDDFMHLVHVVAVDDAYVDFTRRASTKHKRNGKTTVRLKRAWRLFDK